MVMMILFKSYLMLKELFFNDKHVITIKGYDVELYAQDTNEILDATGIYSVLYAKWLKNTTKT